MHLYCSVFLVENWFAESGAKICIVVVQKYVLLNKDKMLVY